MKQAFAAVVVAAVVLAGILAGVRPLTAQDASLEYRVKAAYIYNFMKYVEWPDAVLHSGSLNICVAGRNPFGDALTETVAGERIGGQPVMVRVILEPEPGCHVLFVPDGSATTAYLRATRSEPVLTVGETPDFIAQGGTISFILDGGNVRFEIDQESAERQNLKVSSRLLRLARTPERRGRP